MSCSEVKTCFNIARLYNRTLEEVAQANGIAPPYVIHAGNQLTIPAPGGGTQAPAPAPDPAAPQPTGESPRIPCSVASPWRSSPRKYGTTYIVLAEMNGIANPDVLHVGQVLRVPAPASAPNAYRYWRRAAPAPAPTTGTYTVQRGDSLAIIAAKFNINYFELARLNGISDPDVLHVGHGAAGAGRAATSATGSEEPRRRDQRRRDRPRPAQPIRAASN